jgi:hypothetical protein
MVALEGVWGIHLECHQFHRPFSVSRTLLIFVRHMVLSFEGGYCLLETIDKTLFFQEKIRSFGRGRNVNTKSNASRGATRFGPVPNTFQYWLRYIVVARTTRHRKHSFSIVVEACYHVVTSKQSRRGPHRKYLSFLSRIVIAACLLVWYPATDGLLFWERSFGTVFIEPLPSYGHVHHNIIYTEWWFEVP